MRKRSLSGIGLNSSHGIPLALSLGCKWTELPISHLGLRSGGNPGSVGIWKPVMDTYRRKLASWKKDYLFMGGRVALGKAIMAKFTSLSLIIVWYSLRL